MFQTVDVVWQNTQFGEGTPQGYTVSVPKGERLNLVVAVKSSDGTIPDLRTGTVTMRLVDFNLSPVYSQGATGTLTGSAEITINLPASIQAATYAWDLWLTIDSVRYQLMPLSVFHVLDSTFSLT